MGMGALRAMITSNFFFFFFFIVLFWAVSSERTANMKSVKYTAVSRQRSNNNAVIKRKEDN